MPFLCLAFLILGLLSPETSAHSDTHFTHTAMTTRLTLQLPQESAERGRELAKKVWLEFDRIEQLMSSYIEDSQISRINRLPAGEWLEIDIELWELLQTAERISQLSDGAFDLTYASVGYLYDYRQKRRPDRQQLGEAIQSVDFRLMELDPKQYRVRFLRSGMRIDLGGIAKGYAVDRGIQILQAAGVRSASLSAGGDLYLLGEKHQNPWIVGVRDPRSEQGRNAVVLPLSNTAVSTSGDYERYFMDGDERVHHIISPLTGRSAEGLQSVTILGPETRWTDGLSTAVFVLGLEAGLDLIDRLPAFEAILIDADHRLHYSRGLQPPGQPASPPVPSEPPAAMPDRIRAPASPPQPGRPDPPPSPAW